MANTLPLSHRLTRGVMILFCAFSFYSLAPQAKADNDATEWHIAPEGEKTLTFSGSQMGVDFTGVFTTFTPTIFFNPNRLEASSVTVNVSLSSAETDDTERDEALQNDEWFHTEAHPIAHFQTTSITLNTNENDESHPYIATGMLNLKGVEKEISLPFSFSINDDQTAHATGTTTLNRLDFSIGAKDWRDPDSVGFLVDIAFALDLVIHN